LIAINPGATPSFLQSRAAMTTEPGKPARILLVDGHPIVRLGVRLLLDSLTDLAVCGEADSMLGALDAVNALQPDLVVLDLAIGDGDGLDLIRQLHLTDAYLPVVVFSIYEEETFAEVAFMAGARGYVMKHEPPSALIETIRRVLATTDKRPAP
jgi:DNA-binding NarL/FixJ family response regulator